MRKDIPLRKITLAASWTFLLKACEIIPDLIYGVIVDFALHREKSFLANMGFTEDLSTIYGLGGAICLSLMASNAFQFLSSKEWKHISANVQYRLRIKLISHLLSKRQKNLQEEFIGLNYEIERVESFFSKSIEELLKTLFTFLLIGSILFSVNPVFLFYNVIPIPIIFFYSLYQRKKMQAHYTTVKNAEKKMRYESDEVLNSLPTILNFRMEKRVLESVESTAAAAKDANKNIAAKQSTLASLGKIPMQLALLSILIHGSVMVFHREIPFGTFAVMTLLSRKFLIPLNFFATLVENSLKGLTSLKHLLKTLNQEKADPNIGIEFKPSNNLPIKINKLVHSFGSKTALKSFSAEFEPDKISIIRGQTGCGKTTLFGLLLRDIKTQEGSICYGEKPIQEFSLSSWLKYVAIVPQHPMLFRASLRDNITLFDSPVDEARLKDALDISLVSAFLPNLSEDLETQIGGSVNLSGGQIQSVAIARAWYKNAPILLLDEPTSGFDLKSEIWFIEMLKQKAKGKTIIMSSHRQYPIDVADKIIELPLVE